MKSILDIARKALQKPDEQDDPPALEIDPNAAIRRGLLTGRLQGWHLSDGIEVDGLADWHAEALGISPRENDL